MPALKPTAEGEATGLHLAEDAQGLGHVAPAAVAPAEMLPRLRRWVALANPRPVQRPQFLAGRCGQVVGQEVFLAVD